MRMLRAYQIDRAISFYEKSLDLKQWDLQKSFAIKRKGLGFDNLHFLPLRKAKKRIPFMSQPNVTKQISYQHILQFPKTVYWQEHGLRTPNEDINQRNLKIWVADKICFGCT